MTVKHERFDQLPEKIRCYIATPEDSSLSFDELSKQIFSYQFALNETYRLFCESQNMTPSSMNSWQDIPAVTTDIFKISHLSPTTFPLTKSTTIFQTSGTTSETKGQHHFLETETYEQSIKHGWRRSPLPHNLPVAFLSPPNFAAPQSSLAHMFRTLNRIFNNSEKTHSIHHHTQQGHPLIVFGTALSFLEQLVTESPLALPSGSHLIETGGYKGLKQSIIKNELYQQLSAHFQIPIDHIHNEYSMTELSSQCYTTGLDQAHRSPPWLKIQVIHPETQLPVSEGEKGYLQLHDLANYHSAQVILTQDLATFHDHHTFILHGRDPSALPRGCSRSL